METESDVFLNYSALQDRPQVFYGRIPEFHSMDLLQVLSEKEISRAKQFPREKDKQRFIVTRAILKRLLSLILDMQENQMELCYGKNGKPGLSGSSDLQFNVSHSGDAFVIGFVRGMDIGVDVERLDRMVNIPNLRNYLFTPGELSIFTALDQNDAQESFIKTWTRKEALLKATGNGLAQPMHSLDISILPDGTFSQESDCYLESCTLMGNYIGAIAVKGRIKGIEYIPVTGPLLFNNDRR